MGVYSLDRHNLTDTVEIVADESFDYATGLERMMLACEATDMAIFEAIIMDDMKTTIGLKEGTLLESELAAIQEANIGGMIQTIKTFITKFLEKINGIIQSFISKIRAHYEATLSKAAIAACKTKIYANVTKLEGKKIKFMNFKSMEAYEKFRKALEFGIPDYVTGTANDAMDGKDVEAIKTKLDSDVFGVEFVNKHCLASGSIDSLKNAKKAIEDSIGRETTEGELNKTVLDGIFKDVHEYSTEIKHIENIQKNINKVFKANMKQLDNFSRKIRKDEAAAETYKNLTTCHSVYSYGVRLTNMLFSIFFNIEAQTMKYDRQTITRLQKFVSDKEEDQQVATDESAFIESYLEDVETDIIDADFQY